MKQLKMLLLANLKMTFREKQVWFWSIAFPVVLTVIFLTIFGTSSESSFEAKVVAVSRGDSAVSQSVDRYLRQIPSLQWHSDAAVTLEEAEQLVKKKKVDAAILLPESEDAPQVTMLINKEKETSITTQVLQGIVQETSQQLSESPPIIPAFAIETNFISSGSSALQYADFLITGMIALTVAQAGLFGLVGMVEMRRNGLLRRLMLTPMNMQWNGLANIIVRIILSVIQVVILSLIGALLYGANFHIHFPAFLLVFLVGTLSFAAIGFLIAAVSKSMDSYMGIANIASFVMMFLSGIFFEFSMLPDYIKPLSSILPLTYFANGIRDSMVYGLGMMHGEYWLNIGVMAAWGLVVFFIGSRLYRWKA